MKALLGKVILKARKLQGKLGCVGIGGGVLRDGVGNGPGKGIMWWSGVSDRM